MAPLAAERVKFLDDAARLLASSSPSTAAYLQARVDDLSSGRFDIVASLSSAEDIIAQSAGTSSTESRYMDVCASCGFSLMAGLPKIAITRDGKSKRVDSPPRPPEKRAYVECSRCGAKAYQQLPAHARQQIAKARPRREGSTLVSNSATPESKATDMLHFATPVVVSSSKRKRAKGGKGNSLAAILAKSKQEAASNRPGFGLDLMDFMKDI